MEIKIENGRFAKDYSSMVWEGDFYCCDEDLISLEGCPSVIKGSFNCYGNKRLTSLKGCPSVVEGDFKCYSNQLTSLEGCPPVVYTFDCSANELTSLEGCPSIIKGEFHCSFNRLTSLDGPSVVKSEFRCNNNKLTIYDILYMLIKVKPRRIVSDFDLLEYFLTENEREKVRILFEELEI